MQLGSSSTMHRPADCCSWLLRLPYGRELSWVSLFTNDPLERHFVDGCSVTGLEV
jgi:hypothetical protein